MNAKGKHKPFPAFKTDAEAEDFVENADLTEYDFSGFKPMVFEFQAKSANLSMRMPEALLMALKAKAKEAGIPYQRLIRQLLEQALPRI